MHNSERGPGNYSKFATLLNCNRLFRLSATTLLWKTKELLSLCKYLAYVHFLLQINLNFAINMSILIFNKIALPTISSPSQFFFHSSRSVPKTACSDYWAKNWEGRQNKNTWEMRGGCRKFIDWIGYCVDNKIVLKNS